MYKFNKEKHLHTLDEIALTGTSTVISVIAKPLTWWASGKAVEVFGWTNSKTTKKEDRLKKSSEVFEQVKLLDNQGYLSLLDKAYSNHNDSKEKSAEQGTDLHADLEDYCKRTMKGETIKDDTVNPRMLPFIDWVRKDVKRFLWSELHTYNEDLWIGGISDLGVELKSGDIAIVDFKSSKEAYATQFFQIGGYDLQITKNGGFTADGEKIFTLPRPVTKHIIIPFGAKEPYVVAVETVEDNKKAFKSALDLYRIMSKLNAI